jgi:aryl-alcohol dehydrogenase-like predicted oxidoreductase
MCRGIIGSAILGPRGDEGINFFDDARYNDETGKAPIPTGYSEILFGELFRGAGVRRDEVVVGEAHHKVGPARAVTSGPLASGG